MGPLLERHVLAGELDDFLSDKATKHSAQRSDGAGAVRSNLANNALVNFLDLSCAAVSLVLLVHGFGKINTLSKVLSVVTRVAVLGITESVDGADSKVKILGSSHSEVVHVKRLKHAKGSASSRILSGRSEAFESKLLGDLDVLDKTLARVLTKVRSIDLKLEAVSTSVKDLDGTSIVEFGHTLDLREFNVVTILVSVALVLVHINSRLSTLVNAADDELAIRLTILISDGEIGAVVKEGVGRDTHGLGENEALSRCTSKVVDFSKASRAPEVLSDADDVEVLDHLVGKLGKDADLDVRVKLLELANACLSSGLVADVASGDVEVAALVSNRDLSRIVDLNRFGASEDQVLGDFDTEAAAANDEDVHLDELTHGLETKGANLSGVEVRINLDFFNHCIRW